MKSQSSIHSDSRKNSSSRFLLCHSNVLTKSYNHIFMNCKCGYNTPSQEVEDLREQNRQLYRDKVNAIDEARDILELEKQKQYASIREKVEQVCTTVLTSVLTLRHIQVGLINCKHGYMNRI